MTISSLTRIGAALALAIHSLIPLGAFANSGAPPIVISELQTGSISGGGQEFVELYNPNASDMALDGWAVEYKSASSVDTAASWKKYAATTGVIKAHGFYLISNYLTADSILATSGMSGTAGNIRLIDAGGMVVDQLGYGQTANAAELAPALAPAAGQGLERLPGWHNESGGNATDTNDNSKDFIVRDTADPQSALSPSEPPVLSVDPIVDPTGNLEAPEVIAPATDYPIVNITELLVDPLTPLTDASDEFIELHNPSSQAIDLAGYTLRTGSSFHDYYVFPSTVMQPNAFSVFYSAETHLSLTNGGGAAQLLSPDGTVISQTGVYPVAEPGHSWSNFEDGWRWTLQTTPGRLNVLVPLVAPAAATAKNSKPKAIAATKTVAKPKTSKAKAASTKKAPRAKKVTARAAKVQSPAAPVARQLKPATWLIIGLATLTIGYAIYEFRYDIRNLYYRARGNQQPRG